MKFGVDSTRLRNTVEIFVDWIANGSPPWTAYRAFMSGRLIALDKQPDIRLVGVGETWQRLFDEIVLKVTILEATTSCVPEPRRESTARSKGFKLYGTKNCLQRNGFLNS